MEGLAQCGVSGAVFSNSWRSFMPSCREGIRDLTVIIACGNDKSATIASSRYEKIPVNSVNNRISFSEESPIVSAIHAHTWKTGYIV